VFGSNDTVKSGSQPVNGTTATIDFAGTNDTFSDGSRVYDDTITGFSSAAGDSIHLIGGHTVATSTVSGGNTQIVLNNGSKILLIGVTDISGIFH
jgi:hypothetical protein